MAFDIYGERLEPGHCEIHPWMACEYPCPICVEKRKQSERIDAYSLNRKIHELSMEITTLRERLDKLDSDKESK